MSFIYFNIYFSKIELFCIILKVFNYGHTNNFVYHQSFSSLLCHQCRILFNTSEQTLKIHQSCCSLASVIYRLIHPRTLQSCALSPELPSSLLVYVAHNLFPPIQVARSQLQAGRGVIFSLQTTQNLGGLI